MKTTWMTTASILALSMALMGTPAFAAAPTDKEINDYVVANIKDPAKIADAMTTYHVDLDRIQSATGYTREQMVDYIAKSNNPALKTKLASWNPQPVMGPVDTRVTDADIDNYIRAHINDPAKIAADMKNYNVDLNRIQKATGYSREQMTNYIANSGNADLKAAAGMSRPVRARVLRRVRR